MIGGLDDRDDPQSLVALEAMAGLVKLLDLVEPDDLRPVLLHVAIRIRPFFDSVGWGSTALPCPPRQPGPPASSSAASLPSTIPLQELGLPRCPPQRQMNPAVCGG